MNVNQTAISVIRACEDNSTSHMVTGAFAYNFYGIPRSTKDFDIVIEIIDQTTIPAIIHLLRGEVEFAPQVQFDTLTWGRRHIGQSKLEPGFVVELFELFDDPFVTGSFQRRLRVRSAQLGRSIWLPTAEDVIVQKIRWGRSKDLDDARDVLAVQGPETLDMPYIETWCATHGTSVRLREILDSLPPL